MDDQENQKAFMARQSWFACHVCMKTNRSAGQKPYVLGAWES
jgi:hypothetical protein